MSEEKEPSVFDFMTPGWKHSVTNNGYEREDEEH